MIKKLKYKTSSGTTMELTEAPLHVGCELLFISLKDDEKPMMIERLKALLVK